MSFYLFISSLRRLHRQPNAHREAKKKTKEKRLGESKILRLLSPPFLVFFGRLGDGKEASRGWPCPKFLFIFKTKKGIWALRHALGTPQAGRRLASLGALTLEPTIDHIFFLWWSMVGALAGSRRLACNLLTANRLLVPIFWHVLASLFLALASGNGRKGRT